MATGTIRVLLVAAVVCLAALVRAEDTVTASGEEDEQTAQQPTRSHEEATVTAPGAARLKEVVVEARKPMSAASSQEIRARDFKERPHSTLIQMLNNLPGLVVAQHQGGSKAPQWLIRGFDADHGTDVASFADGLPINMVSHGHGQGYADPNFLIPETIDHIDYYKGPYFVQFGDFSTAAALDFVTKDTFKENFALAEGGSFDSQRYVLGASTPVGPANVLLAGQARYTNGPFDNPENLAAYNGFGKLTLDPTPQSQLVATVAGYASDWDASGQIPLNLVNAGLLPRFGSIDPTEGGRTDRENLNLQWRFTPTALDTWEVQAWASRYKLRLWSDFTFFKSTGLRFIQTPSAQVIDTGDGAVRRGANYIPGDELYQGDSRTLYGGRARYTRNWEIAGVPLASQIAAETRNDDIHVTLQRAVRRQSFYQINNDYVQEHSFSGYWGQQVFPADWVRFEGGLRGDFFTFNVRNRLPTQGNDPNFDQVYIDGSTSQGIVSPKANLIFTPVPDTDLYLNFGTGFHSNDARATISGAAFTGVTQTGTGVAEENVVTPLARAIGYELGARTRQWDRLDAAAALWRLTIDSELVFSGDAGTTEPSPASERYGVDFEIRYRIFRWLSADYDLSWAHARFDNGDFVPLAPSLLMNGGFVARWENGLSAGLRFRYVDDRPANEDGSLIARGYFLMDLIGTYRWRNVELGVTIFNLTNTDWREAQFSDSVCPRQDIQSRNPDAPCFSKPGKNAIDPPDQITFTPGNPIGVRGGVTIFF